MHGFEPKSVSFPIMKSIRTVVTMTTVVTNQQQCHDFALHSVNEIATYA
jgi:hypothetical protein